MISMALQEKYSELIAFANSNGATGMQIAEQDNILYVTCTVPTHQIKNQVWDLYDKIDPDMRAADLVLNVSVDASAPETYIVKAGDNLSRIASKYSGVSWKDIFEANSDRLSHPDKIYPGQELKIPV
jgi:nucleoid-associated protein YgaU